MWGVFFQEVTSNTELTNNSEIKESFMEGGYYSYEMSEGLMVISLNGMYPFTKNHEQSVNGTNKMFDWLQQTLEDNPTTKFLIQTHVWPGYNYFNGVELFWAEEFTNRYLEILRPHQHNHVLSIGAHIHHINIMAQESSVVKDIALVQYITPALTPVYDNNPSVGLLEIADKDLKVERFEFRFFMLEDYHRFGGIKTWGLYNPAKFNGIDLNDA